MNAYSIDGIQVEDILPAILITTINPHQFKSVRSIDKSGPFKKNERVVFISLRENKLNRDEVFQLLENILRDIRESKELNNFTCTKIRHKNFLDSLVIQPNVGGVGLDLKAMWKFLSDK